MIQHPKITQQQKNEILQALCQIAKISIYRDYDLYDVDELMMQINLSIQPVEKALELIDKLLEERKDSYDLYQLVLRKVDLLLGQKEQGKADDMIRQYLYLSEIREMEVEKLMEREQYDEAIRLLDEGIEIAEKEEIMENVLNVACGVPIEIMKTCARGIDLVEVFAAKGSRIALSDAGVGATLLKSAMQGASLNVYINTKSMKDRKRAEELNQLADSLREEYEAKADRIFAEVSSRIR